MWRTLMDKFWNEEFWLPPNITWEDLAPGPDKHVVYTDYRHLLYPIPMAFVAILIRYLLDKHLFAPFGLSLGIKNTIPRKVPANPKLEASYQNTPKITSKQICGLAKQLDLTERQVERWWRLRHNQDKPTTLTKFCEDVWRFTFYFYNFSYGLWALWDKDWLWDIDQCFVGYPHQGLTNDVWWYYKISSAYYWSLTISQFWDVKRKDFWQTFVHHIVTLLLLAFSWVCNMHRVGTMVFLVHDVSEIFLETAKAAKYAKYQKLCDCAFAMFVVVWFVTRLYLYPFLIIRSAMFQFPKLVPMFPAYYVYNSLLCLLLLLHIVWTWFILQIAYSAIFAGQVDGDIRSSSENEMSDSSPDYGTPIKKFTKKET